MELIRARSTLPVTPSKPNQGNQVPVLDVVRVQKLIPKFTEEAPDEFFDHFEKVASGSSEGSLCLEELFQGSDFSHSTDQEEISQEDEEDDDDEEEEPDVPEETPSSQSVTEDSSETTVAELADIGNSALEVGQHMLKNISKYVRGNEALG
ncbi:uncharacterized protein LOC135225259 [Macrobrachium nipponense]|uniref:uncharacterized protein LOC135225259 n=1 Tax=Macrobrachium nipponense TaxID=159736 RepID=UPI0030C8915B